MSANKWRNFFGQNVTKSSICLDVQGNSGCSFVFKVCMQHWEEILNRQQQMPSLSVGSGQPNVTSLKLNGIYLPKKQQKGFYFNFYCFSMRFFICWPNLQAVQASCLIVVTVFLMAVVPFPIKQQLMFDCVVVKIIAPKIGEHRRAIGTITSNV